jgi:hypothetical protein
MSDDETPLIGPNDTAYRLELTPAQLKITYTALKSLLDDFGHDEPDVHRVIHEVIDKLPDEHSLRDIRIGPL